jgi:hypothetical protein
LIKNKTQVDVTGDAGSGAGSVDSDLISTDSIVSTLPVLLVKMSTFLTPVIYLFFNPQVPPGSMY